MSNRLRELPTVTLRQMRDEAMTQAPEWRDVGQRADRIMQEREAETDGTGRRI